MDIMVYFRKKQFFTDTVGFLCIILLAELLLYPLAYLSRIGWIYMAVVALIFILFVIYPWLWGVVRYFLFHKPILIINKFGVQLYSFSTPCCFFISWAEIKAIVITQYHSRSYICIYPKGEKEYLARFSFFRRFIIRLWSPKERALLHIFLRYLDSPAIEIFQQISHRYASELQEYNIHLEP